MTGAALPDCAMLWIGERLTAVERACMRSVLAQGHPLVLYCYRPPQGIPEGVEVADAADVIPEAGVLHHRSGSVALFSDWFRFELQRQGLGLWLDTDAYLLRSLEIPDHGHVFGWCENYALGAGVLHLPSDSPIIASIVGLFESPHIPHWLRWPDRLRAHIRRLLTGRVNVGHLPWGVAGPLALTSLAKQYGVIRHAAASHVYYPWDYSAADWIFDPDQALEGFIHQETRALHLYNFMISARKEQAAPAGSFMARLQREGA